jgi:hypothetical protein
LQPLVRSWARYRTRLFAYRPPVTDPDLVKGGAAHLPLGGCREVAYWSEGASGRTDLLGRVIAYFKERGWGMTIDSGWSDWDLAIYCHPWTVVQVSTAQEEHGGGQRLIRVRYRLRAARPTMVLAAGGALAAGAAVFLASWPVGAAAAMLLGLAGVLWWRGTYRASPLVAVFDALAQALGLLRCEPTPVARPEAVADVPPASADRPELVGAPDKYLGPLRLRDPEAATSGLQPLKEAP